MLLQVSDVYLGIGYYEGLSLILWIISVILLFISFGVGLFKARKLEMKTQKIFLIGYGLFGFLFGLARVFFIFAFFNPPQFEFFTQIAYITGVLGIICILYILETYMIQKTKRIFFIITVIAFIITLISLAGLTDRYIALYMLYIILPFSIAIVLILYIYLILKTTGVLRQKAIGLFIGLILIEIGYSLDTEFFLSNFTIPLEIAPLCMIGGIIIFMIAQLRS